MPDCDGLELGRRIRSEPSLRATRLVMLSSSAQYGEAQRCSKEGFAGYLLKPVTRLELMQCVGSAMAVEKVIQQERKTTPARLPEAVSRSDARVLLAEDNLVNQKVARATLAKLGYSVDIVGTGGAGQ